MVAAGGGSRFGALKQYEALGDRRVLDWAVDAARTAADGVVMVVPPDRLGDDNPPDYTALPDGTFAVVAGGPTRSDSVRNGLAAVPDEADVILVHDAARPLASPALFAAVVEAVRATKAVGAVPGLAVIDTVKRVRDGLVVATLDRSELVAVQTPQAFVATMLRRAHEAGGDATDDAALVEAQGGTVVVVAGELANRKLTTPDDLAWARDLVAARG